MNAGCSTRQDRGRATLLSVGAVATSDKILMLLHICALEADAGWLADSIGTKHLLLCADSNCRLAAMDGTCSIAS